jgi:hypothetical protein
LFFLPAFTNPSRLRRRRKNSPAPPEILWLIKKPPESLSAIRLIAFSSPAFVGFTFLFYPE